MNEFSQERKMLLNLDKNGWDRTVASWVVVRLANQRKEVYRRINVDENTDDFLAEA